METGMVLGIPLKVLLKVLLCTVGATLDSQRIEVRPLQ